MKYHPHLHKWEAVTDPNDWVNTDEAKRQIKLINTQTPAKPSDLHGACSQWIRCIQGYIPPKKNPKSARDYKQKFSRIWVVNPMLLNKHRFHSLRDRSITNSNTRKGWTYSLVIDNQVVFQHTYHYDIETYKRWSPRMREILRYHRMISADHPFNGELDLSASEHWYQFRCQVYQKLQEARLEHEAIEIELLSRYHKFKNGK
jgi:hypothetical protein